MNKNIYISLWTNYNFTPKNADPKGETYLHFTMN